MRRLTVVAVVVCFLFVAGSIGPVHDRDPHVSETTVPFAVAQALPGHYLSDPIPSRGDVVGVTWDGRSSSELSIRGLRGDTWSEWSNLPTADDHAPDRGTTEASRSRSATEPTAMRGVDAVQVRVDGNPPADLALSFVDVEESGRFTSTAPAAAGLTIRPRSDWDPNNTCKPRETPEEIQVNVAFIHHTGIDRAYSQGEVPNILLGYCLYHRNTRGWSDIAYNFFVDRYGTVWEGRAGGIDKGIRGGHTQGFNSYSTGIALIGNYTTGAPTWSQQHALTELLTWKLGVHNVDPYGNTSLISLGSYMWDEGERVTFASISGHRDAQATSCPGAYCYNLLGSFRSTVASAFRATPIDTYGPTVTGDFTGDGVEDGAAYRPSTGHWVMTDGAIGDQVTWYGNTTGVTLVDATVASLNGGARDDIVAIAANGDVWNFTSGQSNSMGSVVHTAVNPRFVRRMTDGASERTVVVQSNGTVLVGPDFTSIGSAPNPADVAVGDLDGDSVDEVVVLSSTGILTVLAPSGAAIGTATASTDADRIVVDRFNADRDSIAAVDTSTGSITELGASGAKLAVRSSLSTDTLDHITEVFAITRPSGTRLLVWDALVGVLEEVTLDGDNSHVTTLEDQRVRTPVRRNGTASGTFFLSYFDQELAWLRSDIGYGQDGDDTTAVNRVSGASRFTTNVMVNVMGLEHADQVVIATGRNFPDALSAGAAAAASGSALLLVEPTTLPSAIRNEVIRLGATRAVIAGGTSAVSDAVAKALRNLGVDVERMGGADRFDTAALLSKRFFPNGAETVYVATGINYPDALAAVPAAAIDGAPILLVSDTISASTRAELIRLSPQRIVILGGTAAVSTTVADQARTMTGATVTRIGGADRYGTAVQLSKRSFDHASTVFITTGTDFVDALISGPTANELGGPVLLAPPNGIPVGVRAEIERLRPDRIVFVGSTGDLPDALIDELDGIGPSTRTTTMVTLPRP
jgi:putative cell wall-binding protein